MQPAVKKAIRKRLEFGFSPETVARDFNVAIEVVQETMRVIRSERAAPPGIVKKKKRKRLSPMEELRRQGYSDEQIRAVFGE
jgi:hypothetical protein